MAKVDLSAPVDKVSDAAKSASDKIRAASSRSGSGDRDAVRSTGVTVMLWMRPDKKSS